MIYHAKTRKVEAIKSGGIALRMIPDISQIIKEKSIDVETNDVVVLYTDGITEARNPEGEMYGLERFRQSLEKNGDHTTSERIFDLITKDFSNFVGEYVQTDDITMIVAKKTEKNLETRHIKLNINADEEKTFQKSKVWDWE